MVGVVRGGRGYREGGWDGYRRWLTVGGCSTVVGGLVEYREGKGGGVP